MSITAIKIKDNIILKNLKRELFSKNNIIGLSLLLGVMSIVYSSAYIILGTNGWVPIALVTPQMILAALILAYKFVK